MNIERTESTVKHQYGFHKKIPMNLNNKNPITTLSRKLELTIYIFVACATRFHLYFFIIIFFY